MRIGRVALLALAGAGALLFAAWWGEEGTARDIAPVEVVNLPEIQEVRGTVDVGGPIPGARMVRLRNLLVPPVARSDTTSLVDAGRIDGAGFTHVMLALRGEVQGELGRTGPVGALLLPEEEPVLRAFREEGRFQFPLEEAVTVGPDDRASFSSSPSRRALAFPSYRVLLYNGTDRTVEADLYAYLTN